MTERTSAAGARAKRAPSAARRLDEHVEGVVSSIGPRLRQLRHDQRLSLQQLAVRAEVSAAAIHKIERNDMVPTITTLLKISAALERPVSYFIERTTDPRSSRRSPARGSGRPCSRRTAG
jgi:DNA-binding XRE family transcriptional regulator